GFWRGARWGAGAISRLRARGGRAVALHLPLQGGGGRAKLAGWGAMARRLTPPRRCAPTLPFQGRVMERVAKAAPSRAIRPHRSRAPDETAPSRPGHRAYAP